MRKKFSWGDDVSITYWEIFFGKSFLGNLFCLAPQCLSSLVYRVGVPLLFVWVVLIMALLPWALWRRIVPQGKE